MALPERAYYPLEKAVEKLNNECGYNLDVQDLLHFAAIEQLELCVFISGDSSEYIEESMHEKLEYLQSGLQVIKDCGFNVSSFMDFSKISADDVYNCGNKKVIYRSYICDYFDFRQQFNLSTKETEGFSFEGIFAIARDEFRKCEFNYLKGLSCLIETNIFYVPSGVIDEGEFFYPEQIRFPISFKFGVSDFVITDVEFNSFKSIIDTTNDSERINKIPNLKPRNVSRKTENSQAKFIKSLIEAVFGKHVAANPRWHNDNERGELYKLFANKGIKHVCGKALEGWIKDEEVEYK